MAKSKSPGCEGSIPKFSYTIIDLPTIPFDKIVGGPQLHVVLGVLKKLTEGFEEEFDDALVAAAQIEDLSQCTELVSRSLRLAAKVFVAKEKKFDREQVTRSLHKVFKGREEKMTLTIFDELEARGEAKGRMEGRMEGEARGKVEGEADGLKKAIIHILKSRFLSSSIKVEKKMSKITNTERLAVLLERALYCESLKAFSDSIH